ncbi:hypothetical protein J4760_08090 [Salinicoccus sp. ID82-1]|uniref:Uncharacterized protein n=1 Tax=Salinicoccus cyprini TaxID=2493691 RepID=A0A558AX76_9STAP|nr:MULTISPECIES: hypothetical protein [Salinicoccus]MCG1009977.1 hypothetical protein [Salinicoccus sp. ID82-1]TVT28851.1 hypothetical protein FO441_00805 [Salinicoccus cyprini]
MTNHPDYETLKDISLKSLRNEARVLNELKIVDQEMSALRNENARLKRELRKYKTFLPIKAALKVRKMLKK